MKGINCTTYNEPEVMQVKKDIKPTVVSDGIFRRLKTSSEGFILNMIVI